MLGVLWSTAGLIFNIVSQFITAVLGLALNILLFLLYGPCLPLGSAQGALQSFQGYFQRGVKLGLGLFIHPVILSAYVAFVMILVEVVIISGSYSIFHAIAGDAARRPDFSIGTYLEENDAYTQEFRFEWFIQAPTAGDYVGAAVDNGVTGVITMGAADIALSQLEDLTLALEFNVVDLDAIAKARNVSVRTLVGDLTISFVAAFLIMYIAYALSSYVPILAHQIANGMFEGVNLAEVVQKILSR